MASLTRDSNGACRLIMRRPDGQRHTIRLGRMPAKVVREIRPHLESLVASKASRTTIDEKVAKWLGEIDPKLYAKLATAGLAPERSTPETTLLGPFIDSYLARRTDIKWRTRDNLMQSRRNLVGYFGENKPMADVTEGDADDWRLWMASEQKLGDNTIRRHCGRARQYFRAAVKRRLIASNPFAEMKDISVQANKERFYYVTREEAQKVLDACPNDEWKLIFALSRFGGLRCPSEHLGLRWSDIDWDKGRMTVRSPKTEHHQGKDCRIIPIFPEIRPYLESCRKSSGQVIAANRKGESNLRLRLRRIIREAGLKPWPKVFQNLRSTRQTELTGLGYKPHVVCAWIGNSEKIAREHYLQITDADYEQAARPIFKGDSEVRAPECTRAGAAPDAHHVATSQENARHIENPCNSATEKYPRQESNLRPTV